MRAKVKKNLAASTCSPGASSIVPIMHSFSLSTMVGSDASWHGKIGLLCL